MPSTEVRAATWPTAIRNMREPALAWRVVRRKPLRSICFRGENIYRQAEVRGDLYAELLRMNVFRARHNRSDNHAACRLCPLFHHQEAVYQRRNRHPEETVRNNEQFIDAPV